MMNKSEQPYVQVKAKWTCTDRSWNM